MTDTFYCSPSIVLKEITFPRTANEDVFLGYLSGSLSFLFFATNTRYLLPLLTPSSARATPQKAWKWRNTINSAIHSVVTGFGSILNLWLTPELRVNLISVHTVFSVIINAISVGYFIHDFFDLLLYNFGKKNTTELLVHHVLVTICFGLALVTCRYQGYAMVSLLLEVNSVFLHIRQLCILHEIPKQSALYGSISYCNIATFLGFRLLPLSWQIRWLAVHQDEIPNAVVILGFVTSAIIMVINLGLLVQIVKKDFTRKDTSVKSNLD